MKKELRKSVLFLIGPFKVHILTHTIQRFLKMMYTTPLKLKSNPADNITQHNTTQRCLSTAENEAGWEVASGGTRLQRRQ